MSSLGIRYVFCTWGPDVNCPGSGGDYDFTGAQKNVMRTAFANWTNAKTANESNLTFAEISAIYPGGVDNVFTIQLFRMSHTEMAGLDAIVSSSGFKPMDYNSDGVQDEVRVLDARIEFADDVSVSRLTYVTAHEIGHVMGLDDCASCPGTVMTYLNPAPESPSFCDNEQVRTMFP